MFQYGTAEDNNQANTGATALTETDNVTLNATNAGGTADFTLSVPAYSMTVYQVPAATSATVTVTPPAAPLTVSPQFLGVNIPNYDYTLVDGTNAPGQTTQLVQAAGL
jgi:hypothetical protein